MFIFQLLDNPRIFVFITFITVMSICMHEFAHAYTAYLFGDETPKETGHLTLNPLKQMGLYSLVMFLFLGVAWGSVPVDVFALKRKSKYADVIVSAAGPLVNLGLAAVGLFSNIILSCILMSQQQSNAVITNFRDFMLYLFLQNFVLLIINLIPIPGMDGWNILQSLSPKIAYVQIRSEWNKGIMLFFVLLIFIYGFQFLYMLGFQINFQFTKYTAENILPYFL